MNAEWAAYFPSYATLGTTLVTVSILPCPASPRVEQSVVFMLSVSFFMSSVTQD